MNNIPMNSMALGDGLPFIENGIKYKVSKIEYDDQNVISTITPPHPLASSIIERRIKAERGCFTPEVFLRELSDAIRNKSI